MNDKELMAKISEVNFLDTGEVERVLAFMKFEGVYDQFDDVNNPELWDYITEITDGTETSITTMEDFLPSMEITYKRKSYIVLSKKEAIKNSENVILNQLNNLDSEFISDYIPISDIEAIQAICNTPNGNETIKELLWIKGNLDNFINDAIEEYGLRHFLSWVDRDEYIEEVNRTSYYIYRTE